MAGEDTRYIPSKKTESQVETSRANSNYTAGVNRAAGQDVDTPNKLKSEQAGAYQAENKAAKRLGEAGYTDKASQASIKYIKGLMREGIGGIGGINDQSTAEAKALISAFERAMASPEGKAFIEGLIGTPERRVDGEGKPYFTGKMEGGDPRLQNLLQARDKLRALPVPSQNTETESLARSIAKQITQVLNRAKRYITENFGSYETPTKKILVPGGEDPKAAAGGYSPEDTRGSPLDSDDFRNKVQRLAVLRSLYKRTGSLPAAETAEMKQLIKEVKSMEEQASVAEAPSREQDRPAPSVATDELSEKQQGLVDEVRGEDAEMDRLGKNVTDLREGNDHLVTDTGLRRIIKHHVGLDVGQDMSREQLYLNAVAAIVSGGKIDEFDKIREDLTSAGKSGRSIATHYLNEKSSEVDKRDAGREEYEAHGASRADYDNAVEATRRAYMNMDNGLGEGELRAQWDNFMKTDPPMKALKQVYEKAMAKQKGKHLDKIPTIQSAKTERPSDDVDGIAKEPPRNEADYDDLEPSPEVAAMLEEYGENDPDAPPAMKEYLQERTKYRASRHNGLDNPALSGDEEKKANARLRANQKKALSGIMEAGPGVDREQLISAREGRKASDPLNTGASSDGGHSVDLSPEERKAHRSELAAADKANEKTLKSQQALKDILGGIGSLTEPGGGFGTSKNTNPFQPEKKADEPKKVTIKRKEKSSSEPEKKEPEKPADKPKVMKRLSVKGRGTAILSGRAGSTLDHIRGYNRIGKND